MACWRSLASSSAQQEKSMLKGKKMSSNGKREGKALRSENTTEEKLVLKIRGKSDRFNRHDRVRPIFHGKREVVAVLHS